MANPIIILGAGASFDYIESGSNTKGLSYQPQITNKLCDPKIFTKIVNIKKEADRITSDLNASIFENKTLEDRLTEIKEIAKNNEDRQRQLIAFEFFLQDLFKGISENYEQPGNNYTILRNDLNDYNLANKTETTVVTFNYDTLFDRSIDIPDKGKKLDTYIAGKIKLIKLHGSWNWRYILGFSDEWGHADPFDIMMKFPSSFFEQNKRPALWPIPTDSYIAADNNKRLLLHPALAIPLSRKKNDYICPDHHIDVLENGLKSTDRILLIGWKANDVYLRDLISKLVQQPVKITIVSGTQLGAEKIMKALKVKDPTYALFGRGFSAFMRSDHRKSFFS